MTYNIADDPRIKVYVNGTNYALVDTNFVDSTGLITNEKLGVRLDGFWNWHGSIGDVRQWTVELTQAQIVQLYKDGRSTK